MWEKGKIPTYLLVFALRDNERIYEWAMRASCPICIVYSLFLNMNRLPIQNNNLRKFSAINEEQEQSYLSMNLTYHVCIIADSFPCYIRMHDRLRVSVRSENC